MSVVASCLYVKIVKIVGSFHFLPLSSRLMVRAKGIDVSHFRPVKDWDAVWAQGVSFVGMKATQGLTFLDPTLRTHRDEFRKRPFLLGIYYHYAQIGQPRKQAQRLMDAVGQLRSNERLCLDLESSPTSDPRDAIEWVEEFYDELMIGVSDRRPLIYTSLRNWEAIGNPSWSLASGVDLWVARYSTVEPELPPPWKDVGWCFWQWSDGRDPTPIATPGVGPCDLDYFKDDELALAKYSNLAWLSDVAPVVT